MPSFRDELVSHYFKLAKSEYRRCLSPGMSCTSKVIRAHSIQNSKVLDLLARNGHVKAITKRLSAERPPDFSFEEIGRNQATTFTGFCSFHDTEIFRPIDTADFDRNNPEHIFLMAYRSIAREMHASLHAASTIQATYLKRIELGLDPSDSPSESGLLATQQMMKAFFIFQYKANFDIALIEGRFDSITNQVFILMSQTPAIAVSLLFSLDGATKENEGWVNVSLNIFPNKKNETVVIFSYLPEDQGVVKAELQRILEATGEYQKYELSKLVLNYCDNFVIAPTHFDTWLPDKTEAIQQYFISTILKGNLSNEDERLFLF